MANQIPEYKSPMNRHGISSNNHIMKWEIAKELGSVVNEITFPADVKLKRKSEQEKINGWESEKQSTCHSE